MENLFWQLFNCNGEKEVDNIVNTNDLLLDPKNWQPYGGNKGNFGTFENQQPNAIPALVEKITNSIDSILTKECRLRNIDPKKPEAPNSMLDAVEKFFDIKNGDFSEIGTEDRRHFAENIQVILTADRQSPDVLVYDNGEGQNPKDFPSTFLSIAKNNKAEIQFVQGKYNMGSTGAVVFCGEKRYQLIASKRNVKLSDSDGLFGFTLVRRHPLSIEEENMFKATWYEYFCPNGKIPQFEIDQLDIGLDNNLKFESGAIVKLYSYELPTGSRSDATLDLWRDLNQYLYLPALPILINEKRFTKGHSQTKLVLGNKNRLVIDDKDSKEIPTISINVESNEIGKFTIEASVFKPEVDAKNDFIKKGKAVIFTINGQTQGFLNRSFVSQELKLNLLKDHLLIQVDCTNMRPGFRQDLFMANRYNLKESNNTEKLKKLIIEKIRENAELKKVNQDRKEKLFHNSENNTDLLKSLAKKLPMSEELKNLLKKTGTLNFAKEKNDAGKKSLEQQDKKQNEKQFEGKRFPSFFKLQKVQNGKNYKAIPLNGKGIIHFETDVENEYFFRPKEKGELILEVLSHKKSNKNNPKPHHKGDKVAAQDLFEITKTSPNNGCIKISFKPNDKLLDIGDEIELKSVLTSPDGDIEAFFNIKITDPQKEQIKPKKEKYDEPNLPIPVKVFKEQWEQYNWTENDIVRIFTDDSDKDMLIGQICINMDSYVLKRYLSKVKSSKDIGTKTNKYFSTIYFHALYLYSIFVKQKQSNNEHFANIEIDDYIAETFKSYAEGLVGFADASISDDADEE